jgi:hypothetical protein
MPRGREKAPFVTDDALWYKDAIIYQLHVKTFLRQQRRRIG